MKKTTVKSIAAVSMLGAAAIALGAVSSWFTNWNAKTWFNHWGQGAYTVPNTPDTPSVDPNIAKNNAVLTIDNTANAGINLLSSVIPETAYSAESVVSSADSAYKLTATIEPLTATYSDCVWSVDFVSASSAWATGKTVTDYVTVSPDSSDSKIANVVCLKPFGERIIITVKSERYESVGATCYVDYVKRASNISFDMESSSLKFGSTYTVNLTADYSVGTKDGTLSVPMTGFGMTLTPAVKNAWALPNIATYQDKSAFSTVSYSEPFYFTMCDNPADSFFNYDSSSFVKPMFLKTWKETQQTNFIKAISSVSGDHAVITIPYEYTTENSVADTSGTLTANVRFNTDNLTIAVTKITLNQNNIVF